MQLMMYFAASAMATIIFFVYNGWIEIPLIGKVKKLMKRLRSYRRCFPSVRSTTDRNKSNSGSANGTGLTHHSGNAHSEEDSVNFLGQRESMQFTDAQRRSVIATKFIFTALSKSYYIMILSIPVRQLMNCAIARLSYTHA